MIILIAVWLAIIIISPETAILAARESAGVWAASVMPSLFPYLALSLLLVSYISGRPGRANKGGIASVMVLGMLGGSPAGAKLLLTNHANQPLAPRAAQAVSAAITTASPMFILGTATDWLGGTVLADGTRMLAAHIVAALFVGGAMYALNISADKSTGLSDANVSVKERAQRHSSDRSADPPQRLAFGEAISQAAITMLTVCGCMIIFNVTLACLARLFPPVSDGVLAVFAGFFEMAGGCAKLSQLNLGTSRTAAALSACVSFGGLSVFLQNAAYLTKLPVKLLPQLAAKLVSAVISYIITRALYGETLFIIIAAGMAAAFVLIYLFHLTSFSSLRLRRSWLASSM
ncbi:sporulation integral membrane protein YlbJ [Clostridia bacterium]|nr:sporulation integral membrane protein YlbJ [Clostridia bacterium]